MSTRQQARRAAGFLGISGLTKDSTEKEIWDAIYAARADQPDRTPSPEAEVPVLTDRTPRSNENRDVSTRPTDGWMPAAILPSPNPIPGWVFYYIRTAMLGNPDNTNVSKKFREGWVPVKLKDHPELMIEESDVDSRFAREGNVEIGGLMLCKAPEEVVFQRQKYYADLAARQIETVDKAYLQHNDPRMPLLTPERRTRTSCGGG